MSGVNRSLCSSGQAEKSLQLSLQLSYLWRLVQIGRFASERGSVGWNGVLLCEGQLVGRGERS